jgi:transcriptional regulator with XRE-family HTH domain
MIDFGKNLATLRKQRQLTQQELADLLDIQPRLLGRWEQGKGKPQFDYIVKLADVLEVTLDRLLRGEDNRSPTSFEIRNKRLKELCKQADKLNADDQNLLCHLLNMAIKHDQFKRIATN